MDATLHIDDVLFQKAQLEATRHGKSVRQWVEEALSERLGQQNGRSTTADERRRQFERLLAASSHFRIGPRPSRDEMNER